MITADQIRAAWKLLGWSGATLAKKAGRSALTIAKAEGSTLRPARTRDASGQGRRCLSHPSWCPRRGRTLAFHRSVACVAHSFPSTGL